MRMILLIGGCLFFKGTLAQVINADFDDWEVIQTGQPYLDPVGWTTNNETTENGLASTPVDRGGDSTGFYARIASNAHGIDATFSGLLSQTIAAENLVEISFDSKCDTIWQTGRCVTRILDQDFQVLVADTLSTAASDFSRRTIAVESAWIQTNDSLTIQFMAKGGIDPWDEEEDGYAVYMIDKVNAEYITGIEEEKQDPGFEIFPNPANDVIYIRHQQNRDPDWIEIYTLTGRKVLMANFCKEVKIGSLSSGVYMLNLISEGISNGHNVVIHIQH